MHNFHFAQFNFLTPFCYVYFILTYVKIYTHSYALLHLVLRSVLHIKILYKNNLVSCCWGFQTNYNGVVWIAHLILVSSGGKNWWSWWTPITIVCSWQSSKLYQLFYNPSGHTLANKLTLNEFLLRTKMYINHKKSKTFREILRSELLRPIYVT